MLYATPADYREHAEADFPGDDVVLVKRLRAASDEVGRLIRLAVYQTSRTGAPRPGSLAADAIMRATVAVVEHGVIVEDPTGALAAQGSLSIGSLSVAGPSARNVSSPVDEVTQRIGSRAQTILTAAGLLPSVVAR